MSNHSSVIRRALSILDGRTGDVPTVGAICRQLNASQGHFNRVFKREVGISPGQYIIETKMARARRVMMADLFLPLEKVARRAGYSSASTLIREFKKRYGQTPHQWRVSRCRSPRSP
jgi:AraC-like DNA-binding protein